MKFDEIFDRDKKREEGAWVKDGFRDLPGLPVKVRGADNSVYQKRWREMWEAASIEDRAKPELLVEMEKSLLLDTILLDWVIEDRPFDREAAKALLETETFRQHVTHASRNVAVIGATSLEADAKN